VFNVEWTGPENEFDSLRIYNVEGQTTNIYAMLQTRDFTTPSKITAPIDVGEYEIRYRTLGRKVLAKDTFEVLPAVATVSIANEVAAGAPIEVRWTGPSNEKDRLRVLDYSGKRLNNYKFLQKKNVTNVVEMTAPSEPGEYWMAYDASSKKILAQTKFVVMPVVAMVSGPKVVKAESDYEVTWLGPNYKGDSIYTFSAEGKDMREYKFLGKKNSTSPITLTAPKQPGTYELRYRIKGRAVIATHSFVVN
jgi:Ca-activated chloride channel family protein